MNAAAEEILSYLRDNKDLLYEQFGVTRIGIFGSFARGDQTPGSDLDIVVDIEAGKKDLHTFLNLKRFLESKTARRIDLGLERSIKPAIKDKVLNQVIYA